MRSMLRTLGIFICLLVGGLSCGEKTGRCTTTCFSKSSGANLGAVTYENYTQSECEQALNNRQTTLTTCTMAWN